MAAPMPDKCAESAHKVQTTLPLSREEKFARLRAAVFPTLSKREKRNVRQLLEKLEAYAHRRGVFDVSELAQMMDCSPTTVRSTIKIARVLDILTVERRTLPNGGQASNAYLVQWDQLRGHHPTKVEGPPSESAGAPTKVEGPPSESAGGRTIYPRTRVPSPLPSKLSSTTTGQPAGRDSSARVNRHDSSAEWEEVVACLLELGLAAARRAVGQAKSNGVPVAEVKAIVAVYQAAPGAWGPGALYWRICSAKPGQDPTKHWAAMDERYQRELLRQAAAKRLAEQERALRNAREQHAREQIQEQALEEAHGAELDALSNEALQRLAVIAFRQPDGGQNEFLNDKLAQDGRQSPLVRDFLLEALRHNDTRNR